MIIETTSQPLQKHSIYPVLVEYLYLSNGNQAAGTNVAYQVHIVSEEQLLQNVDI